MGKDDAISWYQKKIGTYDKQQWERTVERRILDGIDHIQLKSAKPKTELIDLDLVRGSSFTKAKPKHGFITVARLSTLRIVLLPLFSKWWVRQTSCGIFGVLLMLYILQLVNIALYTINSANPQDQGVPTSEIIVPILMMWVLSFIHSQIVATSPWPDSPKAPTSYRKKYRRVRRKLQGTALKLCEQWKRNNKTSGKNVLFKEKHVVIPPKKKSEESVEIKKSAKIVSNRRMVNGLPLEDDGFESSNGNGSSPSDIGDEIPVPNKTSPKSNNNANNKCDYSDSQITPGLWCNQWMQEVHRSKQNRRLSAPDLRFSSAELDSDSDTYTPARLGLKKKEQQNVPPTLHSTRYNFLQCTDEEGECETLSSPETICSGTLEGMTSGTEWMGITTNSEDCSSSELSESDSEINYDTDAPPNSFILNLSGPTDRVSCTIWERRETKKADLSVIEISSVIIAKVESMPESKDYYYIGLFMTTILAFLPIACRFSTAAIDSVNIEELQLTLLQISKVIFGKFSFSFGDNIDALLGNTAWERSVMMIALIQRWVLGFLLFFILAVAERTFKQRFLYAKLFTHLTSSRRARKSELPHFRLNKVRNIKTWLSVRSYLKKRGPQRSVDVIVSGAFIVWLLLLSFLCMELLKESFMLNSQYNLEITIWSVGLGILILRFMTLGVKINKKYRNLSVLITEQINLYLQIEQEPKKKEGLMVANSVLKLAADLLKELESQFKILGFSANPFLYNITKVVILSALSGVLSEILGFKLKLHKIKIK